MARRAWLAVLLGLAGCSTLAGIRDHYRAPTVDSGSATGGAGAGGIAGAHPDASNTGGNSGSGAGGGAGSLGGSGGGSQCDAGATSCGGHCVDLSKDPANCGACGHDCLGGKCIGTCEAFVLASTQYQPTLVAVEAGTVYWAEHEGGATGAIRSVSAAGGAPITLATDSDWAQGLAVDSSNVYWTTLSPPAVRKVSLTGGTATTMVAAVAPRGIAVGANNVYWADRASGGPGVIMQRALAGGTPTTVASGLGDPRAVAVDPTSVYWTDFKNGTVMKAPIGGGTATTLATGQGGPAALAVDSADVYWINYNDGNVVAKVPITGGSATVMATGTAGLSDPEDIALDANNVYWTNAGSVQRVAKTGGSAVGIGGGQTPYGIAVDNAAVYWALYNGGAIMKRAK